MKPTRPYPRLHVDTAPSNAIGQAGGLLLTETVHTSGLGHHLKQALAAWKKPFATHDPAKILTDIAITLALGGDALSDSSVLRDEPDLYGSVASNPTITRLIRTLADDADQALSAINTARAVARARVWELAGAQAPNHNSDARMPLIVDIDATLVTAHSEKEDAQPTYKKGFGFHPLLAFIDHGRPGCGEPVAGLLRPGNAGSNTATDHIRLVKNVLAGLPGSKTRPGKKVLIRTDTAGGTHAFLNFLARRRLSYSVGFMLPATMPDLYRQLTKLHAWEAAYDTTGVPRDGADVAELTGVLDLHDWPDGMRVIVRRERPHPGAQLRFDDVDGYRLTAFATNTRGMQLADLEVRHRSRARCEDRIRIAKDTGLQNFPLKGFDQNRIWLAIVALAGDLQAWSGLLAFAGHEIRRWEPKRLRMHIYTVPATIARTARRAVVHLKSTARFAQVTVAGLNRLRSLPGPEPG
ncbi:Transposase DDE domain-containing protein [Brevibacterium aurantiacum]|uniref:Transposase DDE domain-containing protein n=1 Tax=Brevibacterium aurantiacum TaxID=273384 RepID=A0A2H1L023_BREAU|nr:IS1380 family transposase [Brevibacterium aurantiacum]SMY05363.1 Transposase DDE domain-containing protein [Brevibacterium aurantiacum]